MDKIIQIWITKEAHAALKAFSKATGINMQRIASDAIVEYISRRSIARRWDNENQEFLTYEISYPEDTSE